MAACSSIDCSLNSRVLCNVRLQNSNGDSVAFAYPLTVVLIRTNGDTIHYINQKSDVSSFDIPLSNVGEEDLLEIALTITDTVELTSYDTYVDSTTMELVTDTITKDTIRTYDISDKIRIRKSNEPWFESVDCNVHYNHNIFSADAESHNIIDHIVINDAFVTNDASKKNLFLRLRD